MKLLIALPVLVLVVGLVAYALRRGAHSGHADGGPGCDVGN